VVNTHTHVHSRFMALCLGSPGWAGTRKDIHSLTPETCCGSLLHRLTRIHSWTNGKSYMLAIMWFR